MVVLGIILGALRDLDRRFWRVLAVLVLLLERRAVDGAEVVVDGLLPHPVLQQLLLGDARVDRRAVGSVHQLDLGLAFELEIYLNLGKWAKEV